MSANFVRQFAFFLIALVVLTACGSQAATVQTTSPATNTPGPLPSLNATLTPASTRTASATLCLGLASTPASTPQPWVYGDAQDKLAVSRIPIKDLLCATQEEIMRKLVVQWLEMVKKNSQGQQCGLVDYIIDALVIVTDISASDYDIVATVGYRVKAGPLGDCDWFIHPNKIEKDDWFATYDGFGVYRENGYFRLRVLNSLGT